MRRTATSSALLLLASTAMAWADEAQVPSDPAPSDPAPSESASAATGESRPADKGTLGIGIIVGEPTGITAKLYLEDDEAIQAAIGPAFFGGGVELHGEYVWHPWILQDRDSFVLPVYLGPGLRFIDYYGGRGGETHFATGVRGVIGMLFDFKEVPLDVFVEAAGGVEYDFTKHWGPVINLGAGVRYYP